MGATSNNNVCFEVLYQNVEVTSGLTLANVRAFLDQTDITTNALSMSYTTLPEPGCDNLANLWVLTITNPLIGGPTSVFDLTVQANYQAETGSDTEDNSVRCVAVSCP